jgi:DNA-binding MarR family transcriptional regulator
MIKPIESEDDVKPFSVHPRSSFGYLLRQAARRLDRGISRSLTGFELTVSQYHLLRELWSRHGVTVRDLACAVNKAEPSTLKSVNLMQERGLVVVRVDTADRRKRLVFLTTEGARLKKPVLAEVERFTRVAYADVARADMLAAVRVFDDIERRLSKTRTRPSVGDGESS